MPAGVPPLASSGVFSVGAALVIDAPRDAVWAALLDFAAYKEWNAFVYSLFFSPPLVVFLTPPSRNQTVLSPSGAPSPDPPAAGHTLLISPVHLPPTMGAPGRFQAQQARVVITALDAGQFRAAWETEPSWLLPRWLLHAERWQMLTEVVEDGRVKTRYESIEVFNGVLAWVVKWVQGRNLELGVKAMAEGLKRWVEEPR
ncbi:hypothetical protein MIND_00957000 [Mycena indigotica]|uniref:Coenzyme Q-binding protein COQ10 START domain-containing protein n=1 Tax=Mycena indigotica TaxID=2126181 RepID=A0A8H6VX22_9AGAR|nr:uncharacterized protein MIND_00957000 [Mycena indigotica]KAF7297239.1 hypothetical protein MIND_00957000 [Mycena indigotica]